MDFNVLSTARGHPGKKEERKGEKLTETALTQRIRKRDCQGTETKEKSANKTPGTDCDAKDAQHKGQMRSPEATDRLGLGGGDGDRCGWGGGGAMETQSAPNVQVKKTREE